MSDEKKTTDVEKEPEIKADNGSEKKVEAADVAEASVEAAGKAAGSDEAADAVEAEGKAAGSDEAADAVEAAASVEAGAEEVVELPYSNVKAGMEVKVHEVIKDTNAKGEERERVQIFEGIVLGVSGEGIHRTMTVRKVSGGIGVEKIYPLSSPHVRDVEVVRELRTRRSKLWFLRRGKTKRRLKDVNAQ